MSHHLIVDDFDLDHRASPISGCGARMCGMIRAFLLALLVLLLAPDALAAPPAVWSEKSVRVLDYSTSKWDGLVEGMVDEFNAMLPESAPQLVYRRAAARLPGPVPHPSSAIIVCSVPTASFVGLTGVLHDGTTIAETRVMLNDKKPTRAMRPTPSVTS